ncbi:hypothetical protein ACFWDI_11865 [Streptomyces sp. NPDC060064]|uniref:hypothetical protein n=1 Tax=Streptomyces sp. NPDC060064 TaxID=3347049 RepID=UPI0036B1247A
MGEPFLDLAQGPRPVAGAAAAALPEAQARAEHGRQRTPARYVPAARRGESGARVQQRAAAPRAEIGVALR